MKLRLEILLYFIAVMIITSYIPNNDKNCYEENKTQDEIPYIPEKISFAGETVPLERWDVFEYLDKQLLIRMEDRVTTLLVMKRHKRWGNKIKAILREQNIPEDFYYLMLAESASRNAYSYRGAVGFWQFIPSTAKMYGLIINKYIDERLDPIKSTYAACKYFKKAYKTFGDWTNTAASYNMGIAGLRRKIFEQKETSFYNLYLNTETANYIYRILAYKIILQNPQKYNLPPLEKIKGYEEIPSYYIKITTEIPDLVEFAKKYNTSYKMIKLLNPWIMTKYLPTPPRGYYNILLPRN